MAKSARNFLPLLTAVLLVLIAFAFIPKGRDLTSRVVHRLQGDRTVEQRLEQYGPAARKRLAVFFRRAGVSYPPKEIVLVGLKEERVLQVCAAGSDGRWRFVRSYPVLAASGCPGPKLKYGDCQVPEGLYRVVFLNPNSRYHLSLRLDYPNKFDQAMAERDGRTELGGDIMIHGSAVSVGCLAMGNEAAEDLFVLAADTGIRNVRVLVSPVDFRTRELPRELPDLPPWTDELYDQIRREIGKLPGEVG